MNNRITEQFNDWNLRRKFRQDFGPNRSEIQKARSRFLSQIPAGRTPIHHHVAKWRYALVSVLIAILLTGGMATYADQANVAPTHPLYQFKLLSEQVRLDLSTPQQKIVLHQEFADRRLHEIEEVKAASTSGGPVLEQKLGDEFQNEADNTINTAVQVNMRVGDRQALCQHLLDATDRIVENKHIEHIRTHCQTFLQNPNQEGD